MQKKELKELFINSKKTGSYTEFLYNYLVYKGFTEQRSYDFVNEVNRVLSNIFMTSESYELNAWLTFVLEQASMDLELNTLLDKNKKVIKFL